MQRASMMNIPPKAVEVAESCTTPATIKEAKEVLKQCAPACKRSRQDKMLGIHSLAWQPSIGQHLKPTGGQRQTLAASAAPIASLAPAARTGQEQAPAAAPAASAAPVAAGQKQPPVATPAASLAPAFEPVLRRDELTGHLLTELANELAFITHVLKNPRPSPQERAESEKQFSALRVRFALFSPPCLSAIM
jgi:hypothetical protein